VTNRTEAVIAVGELGWSCQGSPSHRMRASRALNASASDDPADVRSIRLNSIDLGSLRSSPSDCVR